MGIDKRGSQVDKTKSPLFDILPTGRGNAMTGRDLAAVLGWELRDITKEICRLRRLGVPICAYRTGYALADSSTNELDYYCRQFEGRLSEIAKTYTALENYRKRKSPAVQGEACDVHL